MTSTFDMGRAWTTTQAAPKHRLAYSQKQAAAMLGVSASHFQRHIRPELEPVFVGKRVLFKHTDLERWLAKQ